MACLGGGSAAPIAFFPGAFRSVGEILPFRAMLDLPAEIATGSHAPGMNTPARESARIFVVRNDCVVRPASRSPP